MSVIVYEHPLSPYAQKVKIALSEKGVEYSLLMPDGIGSGESGEFAAANPRGEVPVLVHDDAIIFDSTIILEYIEDAWPEPPLLPAQPVARARVRTIEDVMDTHYEAINWGLAELTHFERGAPALRATMRERAGEQLARWHAWLSAQLGVAPWFNGDAFGWADLSVVPYLNGAAGFGLGPAADTPLGAWLQRANERPSVAACATAAHNMAMGDNPAGMAAVRDALEAGLFKREYRDHRLEWMIKTGGLQTVSDGLAQGNIRFTPEFPV